MSPASGLAKLTNLGPKSAAMLSDVGIATVDQLKAVGSVHAYLAVRRRYGEASLNLLWALEGALTGRHWQVVAREDRLHLLTLLEQAQARE